MPTRPRHIFCRNVLLLATMFAFVLPSSGPAFGRDEDDPLQQLIKLGEKPFVIVTLAGLERIKNDLGYAFDTAGEPDALDAILSTLENNVNGLNGLDWTRPAGAMVYLNSVFPPSFEFVAFLPVSNVNDFQSMLEVGPVVLSSKAGQEGRYELIGPRNTTQIRMEQGYAFLQMPFMEPDPAFERTLPGNMATMTQGLTEQFDAAITLDVEAVPRATRNLILNVITATVSTQMQQRDGEPESVYEMRRAWMQTDLDGLKLFFDETNRVTIGMNVIPEERAAHIDFLLDAPEGTKMLQEIFESATKESYFTPILRDDAAVSLSMSTVLADRDRQRYGDVLEAFKDELARQIEIENLGPPIDDTSPLIHAVNAVQKTMTEGHLDVFAQCYPDSTGKLAVVGAVRLLDGDQVATGLVDLMNRVLDKQDIGEIEMGYGEHAGMTFHRIAFKGDDPGRNAVFGPNAGLICGIGPRSAWACVGGDEAFDTLTAVIDELTAAYESPQERSPQSTFRVIVNVNQLIELQQGAEAASRSARENEETEQKVIAAAAQETKPGNGGFQDPKSSRLQAQRPRRDRGGQIIRETLAEGDDRIVMDFRPMETGMRMRIRFEEGFVKVFGRLLARPFSGGQ